MHISKEHKKILLNLREPERVTSIIPKSRAVDVKGTVIVAVQHGLDEVRVLRNIGIEAPSPVRYYYDWPGQYKPFSHQTDTVEFLTVNPRAFCLNDMGCISGDALVRVSRKGKSKELRLDELHKKFHALPDKDTWKVRSLMDGRFGMNQLLDVLNKGVKATLRIELEDGKVFNATPDHSIARPDGTWTNAGDLSVGDELVTKGRVVVLPKRSKIVSITDGGDREVFDLCMKDPHNNFVVNGVVVHNSGKTISVLWAFDYLRSIGKVKRMLIISPLSTLERTWADEIFTHFRHLEFTVLHGTAQQRKDRLAMDKDIYIVNHDGIKSRDLLKLMAEKEGLDLIVIDEIASFRNASTDRWKALRGLTKDKDWVWGLTGTPIPRSPTDAWAQVKIVRPDSSSAKYFGAFRDQVMRPVTQYKWVAKEDALSTVHRIMQPAIRFKREDCIDLPPTTYLDRHADLGPEQAAMYKQMLAKFKAECEGGQVTAVNEAVKINKLLQIVSGVAYGDDGDITLPSPDRVAVVRATIEEAGGKVIVFLPFTGALTAVAAELAKDYTVEVIHGGTSKNERDRIFGEFQHGNDPQVLVANAGTMSHGLTLTAADTIIWYSPVHSAETYEQANARIVRPGQKRNTRIVRIEGSDLERRMYDKLQKRTSTQGTLLGMFKT